MLFTRYCCDVWLYNNAHILLYCVYSFTRFPVNFMEMYHLCPGVFWECLNWNGNIAHDNIHYHIYSAHQFHCLVIRYLNHLSAKLKPTSQKHVLMDIEAFLKFVRVANVPKVWMTVKSITCILDKLAGWKKGLGAQIVLQRLEYKRNPNPFCPL